MGRRAAGGGVLSGFGFQWCLCFFRFRAISDFARRETISETQGVGNSGKPEKEETTKFRRTSCSSMTFWFACGCGCLWIWIFGSFVFSARVGDFKKKDGKKTETVILEVQEPFSCKRGNGAACAVRRFGRGSWGGTVRCGASSCVARHRMDCLQYNFCRFAASPLHAYHSSKQQHLTDVFFVPIIGTAKSPKKARE